MKDIEWNVLLELEGFFLTLKVMIMMEYEKTKMKKIYPESIIHSNATKFRWCKVRDIEI